MKKYIFSIFISLFIVNSVSAQLNNICPKEKYPGCDWNIQTRNCHNINVIPSYDACGVCGGDGSSCNKVLSQENKCIDYNIVSILSSLDTSLFNQKIFLKNSIRLTLKKRKISKRESIKLLQQVENTYQKGWTFVWTLKNLAKSCTNGTNCFSRNTFTELTGIKTTYKTFESFATKVAKYLPKADGKILITRITIWSKAISAISPNLPTCIVNNSIPTPLPTVTITTNTNLPTFTPIPNTTPTQTATPTATATQTIPPVVPAGCPTCTLSSIQTGYGYGICGELFYDDTIVVSPAGNYTYSLTGTLPSGLSFNSDSGRISGITNQSGISQFNVIAKTIINGCNISCYKTYYINVGCCQDGSVNIGEQCDDGNSVSGDGCDYNCTNTRCGNGLVTFNEQCDDGNSNNFDKCSNFCTLN